MSVREVVSVSLGSSTRDVDHTFELLGQEVRILRRGVDGDLRAAERLIAEFDGKVDAIGLGGIDLYIIVAGRRYYFREALRMANAARVTPVICGAGLKNSLERRAVAELDDALDWSSRKVLMVSAADRFGMAEALDEHGAELLFGDLMFTLGVNFPLRSLTALGRAARLLLPVLTKVPFRWLYPTGASQERVPQASKFPRAYAWADVVAGDWHLVRRYAGASLAGKTVLTNTTTTNDVDLLRELGVTSLVTTTPRFAGRSIGTNLLEAVLVAVSGADSELKREEYDELISRAGLHPTILAL
ncbi:MAG TPA: quinate 5-dehydrogenase [Trueperaceae bacterium]|nr:quinate 5-dehydrogenase [Trueperaceae bacterium]